MTEATILTMFVLKNGTDYSLFDKKLIVQSLYSQDN